MFEIESTPGVAPPPPLQLSLPYLSHTVSELSLSGKKCQESRVTAKNNEASSGNIFLTPRLLTTRWSTNLSSESTYLTHLTLEGLLWCKFDQVNPGGATPLSSTVLGLCAMMMRGPPLLRAVTAPKGHFGGLSLHRSGLSADVGASGVVLEPLSWHWSNWLGIGAIGPED